MPIPSGLGSSVKDMEWHPTNALKYVYYIYKHSYMFRSFCAIFSELYTIEYDLMIKHRAVTIKDDLLIKQYVVRVVS
jgi:hypothetical protein